MSLQDFYIHTGKDGILEPDTNEAYVQALAAELTNTDKIVIHLHGGLVSEDVALEKARRLVPAYRNAGAHPIVIVWESGFIETIMNNLHEIDLEEIFRILVKMVLKYVMGKLMDVPGVRGPGQLYLPTDIEVGKEFNKRKQKKEPFIDAKLTATPEDLTKAEREQLEKAIKTDPDFRREVQAIINGARSQDERKSTNSKGVTTLHQRSTRTLMSPEVVDELVAEASDERERAIGILSGTALAIRAGKIFARVIRRFVQKRDHGVYATIIEEVLRELYITNIGAEIWGMMKQETADTFSQVGQSPPRGGWLFVKELGNVIKSGHKPEVSVVAHSAGAIYACHLLAHLDWARNEPSHPLPANFKLKNLIFLAPACNFNLFDDALAKHHQAALFENFRMFALKAILTGKD